MSQTKAQLLAPVGIFTGSGINVSGTLTATSYSGSGTNLSGVGVGTTASVNTSGIITAVSFSGDGSNLGGVGFGTEDSAVTTGIVTASKFVGSGIGLTNIGGAIAGLVYSPTVGATGVSVGTNIEIIFSKPIQAGVGTITLRTDAADGTIVESYDISSSDRLTISTAKLTIDPTDNLSGLTTYFVVVPSGTVKDTFAGISSNTAIDTYSFTTQQLNYELWSWGYNHNGQLGQNNLTFYSSPVQIPGTQWNDISYDYVNVLATKSDGTLWGWGRSLGGQLAQNDIVPRSSPVQIPGTEWNVIAAGYLYGAATKTDGTLWVWGGNSWGQLGLGNKINHSSPVQVPGTQWNKLSAAGYGDYGYAATKTDGTLWVWGYDNSGELGQNAIGTHISSPIQIPGTQWDKISSGNYYKLATKTDGTLWGWGSGSNGKTAQNDQVSRSSPIQIPGTQWGTPSAGHLSSMSTKTDGTLWSWGYNYSGELGQNNLTRYSSPVQIPGTDWTDNIRSGWTHMTALKTDGTLWVWARAEYGQLGLNETAPKYSSPVQVPGTQWNSVKGNIYSVFAIKQVAS